MELYTQVKENWIKDYYKTKQSPEETGNKTVVSENFRKRSPFIPFALKNETGSPLQFTTHISDMDNFKSQLQFKPLEQWVVVNHGDTIPFSFRTRGKSFVVFYLDLYSLNAWNIIKK